jgi:tight adherence protein B
LQLVAGALRSGFGLNQSIAAVAREGSEPVASEFARVLQEARLGAELEDALDDLAGRLRSYDMELVVMAIRTAREIGGNLAEVLQTTVTTMRERVQLRAQVRVLSAEGRFSAKILTGMPILMAVYLLLFKKGYLTPMYTTSVGIVIFIIGGVLLVIGSLWLSRLTKIEV